MLDTFINYSEGYLVLLLEFSADQNGPINERSEADLHLLAVA